MTRLALAILLVASMSAACKKKASSVVARLEQMTAKPKMEGGEFTSPPVVERMPRAAASWQGARVGDTFVLGSAVRTGPDSTAKLRVGKNGALDVSPNAVVYFTRTPGRERNDVRVQTGSVEIESGEERIGIGEAVLEPGSSASLVSGPDGTTIMVRVGRVVLEDNVIASPGSAGARSNANALRRVIEQGQSITVGATGKAVAARVPDDATVEQLPAGQVAVVVRDAPARVKTSTGDRELAVGDHRVETSATVTVPVGSTASVSRAGARAVTSGASELRLGDGNTLVDVISGSVALHGDRADAVAAVPGGTITAKTGGAAALAVENDVTAIDGQRGETAIASKKGSKTIQAGESATLVASGDITIAPPAPDRTVVSITAGESPLIHDAKAPAPIRVLFADACPSTGVVEVARDRTFKKPLARSGGASGANVLVPPGSYHYRVRCVGGKGATGTLRVDRESGRSPLPKTAARTTVEMDGREYTILYQNVLPEVTLAWRKAPAKPSYTFVIKSGRGTEKRINNPGATLKLPTGELREGSYRTWVEAVLGARSEESRIVIEFDNAAPSASIDLVEPRDQSIHVKGTALEGSVVSAGTAAIALDRHQRFDSELTPGEHEDGVGVRIAHPKAGIHYYVMRR